MRKFELTRSARKATNRTQLRAHELKAQLTQNSAHCAPRTTACQSTNKLLHCKSCALDCITVTPIVRRLHARALKCQSARRLATNKSAKQKRNAHTNQCVCAACNASNAQAAAMLSLRNCVQQSNAFNNLLKSRMQIHNNKCKQTNKQTFRHKQYYLWSVIYFTCCICCKKPHFRLCTY